MADISDVTAALKNAIVALAYPNGTAQPSALGVPIQVAVGWPLPATLDAIEGKPGVAAPNPITLVSIYVINGSTGDAGTVMNFQPALISQIAPGIAASVDDTETIATFTGTAVGGEPVSLVVDGGYAYGYSCQAGDTPATIASALATAAQACFVDAVADGGAVSIPSCFSLIARVGTTGVFGRKIHRQRSQIRIISWSSNPVDRDTVSKQIDAAFKAQVVFAMPDTSAADLSYQGTNWMDDPERIGLYRRDLIYVARYDTIEEFTGVEVTSVGITTTLPAGTRSSSS